MLFINKDEVYNYFRLIIDKYNKDIHKFIKYFYVNYFTKYPIKLWIGIMILKMI